MVEIIPEIESFFEQKQFSQEQLDELKVSIELKYNDEHSKKLATSAINIKLLQYQLSGPLATRVKEKIKRTSAKLRTKKAASAESSGKKLGKNARKKLRIKKKGQEMIQRNTIDVVEVFYSNTLNKPLKKAAIYLRISSEQLISDLNLKNGRILNENTRFDEDIWEANKDWIKARLLSNHKKAKDHNKSRIKKTKYSSKTPGGVYGKLIKAKTIGPLIYTRMK